MLAYDYCYQPQLLTKNRRKLRFSEDDVLVALESVFQATLVSEQLVSEAEQQHAAKFRERINQHGFDITIENEPYLDTEKLNLQLQFTKKMEKLFLRTESFLHDARGTARKSGISLYAGDAKEWAAFDRQMEWKAFNKKESLANQVGERIAAEVIRLNNNVTQRLDQQRQRRFGIENYIWRSSDDGRVRSSHADNDDQIFRWDSPPATGHPGQDYGCRCTAEPIVPVLYSGEPDLPLEPVYPVYYFIVATRAIKLVGIIVNKIGSKLFRWQADRLFRRPKGVPKNWVRSSSKNKKGVRYRDPKNKHNEVRIQQGNPRSSNLSQQKDYIKWKRNGQWMDKNDNIVTGESPESHIPIKDFKFNLGLFK